MKNSIESPRNLEFAINMCPGNSITRYVLERIESKDLRTYFAITFMTTSLEVSHLGIIIWI